MKLETKRLILRPMAPSDLDAISLIFTDLKVMAAFDSEPLNPDQVKAWLDRNLNHQKKHGYSLFAVILKANNRLIGNCGLTEYTIEGKRELEIGYDFQSDYWGQGFATEAATAVRDYAVTVLEEPRLIGLVRQTNHASSRVLEKIGMYKEKDLDLKGINYGLFSTLKKRHGVA
ncbi:MAG: GNAT family N-acetyltransferase [Anaerolineae bacterium]